MEKVKSAFSSTASMLLIVLMLTSMSTGCLATRARVMLNH